MKKLLIILIFTAFLFLSVKSTQAYVRVKGHWRNNGTYVMPHFRSNPDGLRFNNWSFKDNVNPFTFRRGWRW